MTEVVKSREPATRTRWRLGGALTVLAVATAIGAGGQPAFAAPKPAPGSGSAAGSAATAAGDHQARTAKQKATTTPEASKAIAPNDIRPEAVATVVATPGVTAVTVTWGAASVGTPLHYVVSVATTVGATPTGTTCDVLAGSTHTCLITGLTQAVSYTATVTSYDTAGTTTAVDTGVSAAFLPLVAVAPTAVLTTPVGNGLVVTWTPPAITAGITGYTATTSPGALTCTAAGATANTCTILGLTAAINYTVTVIANGNLAGGNSAASVASLPAIIASAPPTAVTLSIPNSGVGLKVDWTLPAPTTGIASYTATTNPGGATCTAAGPTTTTCTILAPLSPGVAYTVTVVANATVAAGSSVASAPSQPLVPGASVAPTGVVAYMGNGQAMVSWVPPAASGGPLINYYTVTSSPGGKICHSAVTNTIAEAFNGSNNFCTVYGLVSTTAYTFTVVAHSDQGDSAASAPSPLAIPMSLALVAGANGKTVTAENAGAKPLIANRAAAGAWETFDVEDQNDGYVALRSRANGLYVSAEAAGTSWLIANRWAPGIWEEFSFVNNSDGSVSLRARVNGRYVTAENGGASPLIANRWGIGAWEKFSWVNLSS